MPKQITVTCKDGKVVTETAGYKGKECQDATKALEKALGGQLISDDPTPEMFDRPQQQSNTINQT